MTICRFLCGSITIDQLERMPLLQYRLLRKAVEIEHLKERQRNLYDFNRAFNDPKPLFDRFNRELEQLEGSLKSTDFDDDSWEVNSDAANQLQRFQI